MGPINTEYVTAEELLHSAEVAEQSAKRMDNPSAIAHLLGLAGSYRRKAAEKRADAKDLRESAALLTASRRPAPPATTLNPYRELR